MTPHGIRRVASYHMATDSYRLTGLTDTDWYMEDLYEVRPPVDGSPDEMRAFLDGPSWGFSKRPRPDWKSCPCTCGCEHDVNHAAITAELQHRFREILCQCRQTGCGCVPA